jgi:hypothetical protein
MTDDFQRLPLKQDGYIWVKISEIRLIRTDKNSGPIESYFLQLRDGLEYEIFGSPKHLFRALEIDSDDI